MITKESVTQEVARVNDSEALGWWYLLGWCVAAGFAARDLPRPRRDQAAPRSVASAERVEQERARARTSRLLHMDALTIPGSAPRALVEDEEGARWLIGTDGSTERVFWMRASRQAATCGEAHEEMCGFEERRLIAES
jgi:hypothetical protein